MTALTELNKLILSDEGVWCPNRAPEDFNYSDGAEVEKYLKKCFTECADLSSTSTDLEKLIIDWPTEYHLSPMRANVLRAFDLTRKNKVLELGAGCGAITRYLGDAGLAVDAIEGSAVRAALASLRCHDLKNVAITNGNFNTLNLPQHTYDGIFVIGVMEYAKYFSPGEQSHQETVKNILNALCGALSEDGCLVIAIENRLGLKYLFGAAEDHYGKPFTGVYNYSSDDSIRTYSKNEWESILAESDIDSFSFLYPYPDYKIPNVILTDAYMQTNPYAASHFSRIASRDYAKLLAHDNPERIFWEGLQQEGLANYLANSFLIVLSHSEKAVNDFIANDFVHCSELSRAPAYRTLSFKPVDEDIVYKRPLYPDIAESIHDTHLSHRPTQETFLKGELLADSWARLFYCDAELDDFAPLLQRYYDYLLRSRQNYRHSGELLDLLPPNIVVHPEGHYQAIDHEWVWIDDEIDPEFVMFRALLYFAINEHKALHSVFAYEKFENIRAFIGVCFTRLGLDLDLKLEAYIARENLIQSITKNNSHDIDIRDELNKGISSYMFESQLYWQAAGQTSTTNKVSCRAYLGCENQKLSFDLPIGLRKLESIRFSPGVMGFVRLHELRVFANDDNGNDINIVTFNAEEIAQHATLDDVDFQKSSEVEGTFLLKDDEASLLFDLSRLNIPDDATHYTVTIKMDWPESKDFGLFRDHYLNKTDRLEGDIVMHRRQIAELRDEKFDLSQANKVLQKELKSAKQELQLIKSSRVWETAEKGRRLFYGNILGRSLDASSTPKMRNVPFASGATRQQHVANNDKEENNAESKPCQRNGEWNDRNLEDRQWRSLDRKPKLSIVMPVFNTDPRWLESAVESVKAQTYENWELCIVDDCSDRNETRIALNKFTDPKIKFQLLPENKGISQTTNAGIRMASGEYIAFMDHDDELSSDALYELVVAINQYDPDIIYSDEDLIDPHGNYIRPHYKPDYSPDLLLAHNYVTHLLLVRANLVEQVGEFESDYDGAQDYDFVLRACELTNRIHHIPKVLYHWRQTEESTSLVVDAKPAAMERAREVLRAALKRRGVEGEVMHGNMPYFYRVRRKINVIPLVSIVIPFKDRADLLDTSIGRLLDVTTYENFEVIGISNNSELDETRRTMRDYELMDGRVKFYEYNNPFNFSRLVNFGVIKSNGDHIVLMNNDIRIITWGWIEALLEHSQRDEVGAVGAKLYYPDNTIQHAGIVVGIDGFAGHSHKRAAARANGYFNRLQIAHNVSAVTGALMMVKQSLYENIGGFDEDNFQVACNDVDFCLRLHDAGYYNVFTPYAEAYHTESSSRGYEVTDERKARFDVEKKIFTQRHAAIFERGDPFYNPNLTHTAEDFSARVI